MKKSMKRTLSTGVLVLALTTSSLHGVETEAATIRLNCNAKTLTKGSTCKLKVKGTSKKITWKSSNKKVANVNKKGTVTAKKAGTATITATCNKKKMICTIVVKKPCTTKPSAPSTPAPSNKPSSSVTEKNAYATLHSLRNTYPQGMRLTNSYYYYSPRFGNGYGCYGFAAKLSDTVFGTSKTYQTHSDFNKIKVGDNIRIGNYHSVIVLTKSGDHITVVEGNYNSSVNWDRKITASSLAKDGFKVYTRY